ncbi:MAG: sulfatase-like hydrolase/transferase [Planctomycetes bacterium]|nr:sulfatase-like hydrolase/transferase [Planctomycetota bacterium]
MKTNPGVICSLLFVILLGAVSTAAAVERPNFVVVLADDLGYGDLGCFGHPTVRSPNLDRLAAEGCRLTQCYSAGAVCSPSRAGLMTGRTPCRLGINNHIPQLSPLHLQAKELTVAKLLQGAGYATCHVGKWHLCGKFNEPSQPQPKDHGFDYWFSTQNNAMPSHKDPSNFVRNGEPCGTISGYASQIVADEAIDWLSNQRDQAKPFFLYVCFHEPHEPIRTASEFALQYDAIEDPSTKNYFGNITQMDHNLGRLLATLDRLNLRDNTLVWFTSDNGPARTKYHNAGSAGGLREFKGHVYEGGIRVPGIVQWRDKIKPGSTSDEPVCGIDLLPTVCAIAGVAAPADRVIDGQNVWPLLTGEKFAREKPLYWQYPLSQTPPTVALRAGDWKIVGQVSERPTTLQPVVTEQSMHALKTAELAQCELYNLRDDRAETNDLGTMQPEQFAAMRALLEAKYKEVRAEMPVWPLFNAPNLDGKQIEWPNYTAPPLKKK